ncbi:hypothetical protein [Chryseobacterium rhizosphaerae]|uniref:hypothetical protein n=1 Tax=Chryseobacterium rhizosphaerae TaxID=395937 RepID=UPI002358D9CE|nr:hypothetical protein [Chryseobacterium rhizosphaerae]MDC8099772.1 hypothetical protein [Chryseobacterium rhizosphaerae]
MKKLLLLLLFPVLYFSQTSLKDEDIHAAAGNNYETLLTNIGIDREGGFAINHFLHKIGFTPDEKFTQHGENFKQKFVQQIVSGNARPAVIWVSYLNKKVKGYDYPVTQKVDISGDTESIIKFYVNFWSRAINFKDTKPGETVTTRFLSDVAALSVGTGGQSKIVVTTAKDYYK